MGRVVNPLTLILAVILLAGQPTHDSPVSVIYMEAMELPEGMDRAQCEAVAHATGRTIIASTPQCAAVGCTFAYRCVGGETAQPSEPGEAT